MAIGQIIFIHLRANNINRKQRRQTFEEKAELVNKLGFLQNVSEGQMSDPTMMQFIVEQDKEFEKRRIAMRKVCKNLTPDSAKYKPRNETLKFDILWDHHYQVSLNL